MSQKATRCPECGKQLLSSQIQGHIEHCSEYVPTYMNNVKRVIDYITPQYVRFLAVEMEMIYDMLAKKIQDNEERKSLGKNGEEGKGIGKKDGVFESRSNEKEAKGGQLNDMKEQQISHSALKEIKVGVSGKNLSEKTKIIGGIDGYLASKISNKNGLPKQAEVSKPDSLKPLEPAPDAIKKAPSNSSFSDLFLPSLNNTPSLAKPSAQNPLPPIQQYIICVKKSCPNKIGVNECEKFVYLDQCLHTICIPCFKEHIGVTFVKNNGESVCPDRQCGKVIPRVQVRDIIGSDYQRLEIELNRKAIDLVKCLKCGQQYQFIGGKAKDAPKKCPLGKPITALGARHYAQNRFSCPKCKSQQCKECNVTPYHLGSSCAQSKQYRLKKKCRYCKEPLPLGYTSETGIKGFDDICDGEECSKIVRTACSKRLKCGHSCYGFIKEKKCLPCLSQKCSMGNTEQLRGENENSYCSLCYIEALSQSPCIRSVCGHIYHQKCLRRRLQLKWATPRIFLKFCQCPLCNHWLEVPEESSLSGLLVGYKKLYNEISEKSIKRLKHEGEDKSDKLKDKNSPYYENEQKYSMAIYAYFMCYTCQKPYFGGRKNCAEAMNEQKDVGEFNPKELICPGCCPVPMGDCARHGKEFIEFKCKFCCSIAQWFCWGNTHFCDQCHRKQVQGTHVSKIAKNKLPKCEGKGKCPSGGEHGGNGEQHSLGCALCRNYKENSKQF